uniref:Uncharacterized protein n=1 Tax=Oryza punctata TaxID=4537 RepID=A0A0E0M0G4_ORYPU
MSAPEKTSMHKIEVYVDPPVPHHACHGMHLSSTVLVDGMVTAASATATDHTRNAGNGLRRPADGGDDGLMASSFLERTEADEPARHRHHPVACGQSVFITGAGVGAERSTPELIMAAAQIHETSLSDSDRDSQIHKFPLGGRARFICSPLSASSILHATRSEPEAAAAAGKSNIHVAAAPSELSSGNLFDRNVQLIQLGIAGRVVIALMTIMIARFVTVVDRASERKRGGGRRRASSAAVLTMLLLVVAAALAAKPATAARPLSGDGHDEVAAAAPGKPPPNDAAAGHSSCTTDPNTQQPVRCVHH